MAASALETTDFLSHFRSIGAVLLGYPLVWATHLRALVHQHQQTPPSPLQVIVAVVLAN
jgi:hypothetical protein